MRLTTYDITSLKKMFPVMKPVSVSIKRPSKKTSSAILFMAIPKGIKHYMWFIHYKSQDICLLLEMRYNNTVKYIQLIRCSFNKKLCSGTGTILYGSIYSYQNSRFFTIEDIFRFCGEAVSNSQIIKWRTIAILLKEYLKLTVTHTNELSIGLPIITKTLCDMNERISHIIYPIYCIQHRYNYNMTYYNELCDVGHTPKFAYFLVRADPIPDIYKLYIKHQDKLVYYNDAIITSYTNSVYMNNIFRTIRENSNLDLIQESDDDADFENISVYKYTNLNTKHIMKCKYTKFNLWEPMTINEKMGVTLLADLPILKGDVL
jgi:hypothetical protein